VRLPGAHYGAFMDGHERTVEAELSFLHRHLLHGSAADAPAAATSTLGAG
jgi:hypothetical protein